jgi:hypothetical protein
LVDRECDVLEFLRFDHHGVFFFFDPIHSGLP